MQKYNVLNSPRLIELKKRRQKAFVNKILIFLFLLITILVFLAYLSRLESLNIVGVEITGNRVIDASAIKTEVENKISGKYLWVFPKTNILLYPTNDIKNNLLNKFKRLKNIVLSIKSNKNLLISVTERNALYTWCGVNPPEQENTINQKCYFTDEDGYIFDEAPYFSGDVYFKFYGAINYINSSFTESPLGLYFYKQNFAQFAALHDVLVGLKLKPVALHITNNNVVEVLLEKTSLSKTEPKLILNVDSSFESAAENLEAALTAEPLKTDFKNKYSTLEYIDLRFGNKVYYKFK
ncbi:MAG: hypothetical protein WCP17_00705 [bacterium]